MNTIIRPKAILPAPSIGTALDGGLGYNDLVDRTSSTYVEVGPLVIAVAGDTVDVLWDGVRIALHVITATDLAQGAFPIPLNNGQIADRGDGDKVLTYTVTYALGGGQEVSAPTTVKIKRSVPGGLDPHPETPFNENLPPVTLTPHPVPADAAAAVVSVPLWLNAIAGDVMVVSWNGALVYAPPLTAPLPATVLLPVSAAQMLEYGIGPAVPITWGVHDVVSNWSLWAPTFEADVRIEDPGALYAPLVGDAIDGWTVLDLDQLGGADVLVFTPVYQGHAVGDQVTVHWYGTDAAGEAHPYDTTPQQITQPGFELRFDIPNDKATALAGGNVRVWYSVVTVADGTELHSASTYLPVTGATQDLPAPAVREAVNGSLDPDDANPSAHVEIPAYPGMASFDTVTLVWDGTAGNGTPVHYQSERQVGSAGAFSMPVAQADVFKFLDGTADVFYRVAPFSRHARASVRALMVQESAHLPLKVRHAGAEQPLPAPSVDNLVDGVLDPATEEAVIRAPAYPGIAKGDEVTYTWKGTVSTYTGTVKVGDSLVAPPGYVERRYIEDNINGEVNVSYVVRRVGVDPAVPSQILTFRIGAQQALPAPTVDKVVDGTLPIDATNVTTVVPAAANLALDDVLTVFWSGTSGVGSPSFGEYVIGDEHIGKAFVTGEAPSAAIAANAGGTVKVSYKVTHTGRPDRTSMTYSFGVAEREVPIVLLRPEPEFLETGAQIDVGKITDPRGLRVVVKQYQGMALSQKISLRCISPIGNDTPGEQTVDRVGDVEFFIGKAYIHGIVAALDPAIAGFDYTVTADGGVTERSPRNDVTFYEDERAQ